MPDREPDQDSDQQIEAVRPERVRFLTICDDAFVPGLVVLLASLRRHFRGFERVEFEVLYHPDLTPLSEFNRMSVSACFPNVRFVRPDLSAYPTLQRGSGHTPDAMYLSFEVFRPTDARRVVYIDTDMVALRDFSDVLDIDHDFAACLTGGEPSTYSGPSRASGDVNAGFFVVGPKHLDGATFESLVTRLEGNLSGSLEDEAIDVIRDQAIINAVIPIDRIHVLPNIYNFRAFQHLAHFVDVSEDLRILHFSGYWFRPKPWEPRAPLESLAYRLWAEAAVDAVRETPDLEPLIPGFDRIRDRLDAVRADTRDALGILQALRVDVADDLASERYRYGDTALNRVRALTPSWVARLARVVTGARERTGGGP